MASAHRIIVAYDPPMSNGSASSISAPTHGTHDHQDDPRNATITIGLNGDLVPRAQAMVSVFDSGFILGDGIWEGIRVHNGKLAFIDDHLRRLYEGAAALDLDIGLTQDELTDRIMATLAANDMGPGTDGVHIRLMVTRGMKSTPYQDPRFTITPPTVVIIPEYKDPRPETLTKGIRLATVSVRRGRPDVQDPKLNSHSKINCITACIQATKAGADEGLMLDPQGFVATCNSTHFFIVREGDEGPEVWTSTGDYCLPGITRANVLRLCRRWGITEQRGTSASARSMAPTRRSSPERSPGSLRSPRSTVGSSVPASVARSPRSCRRSISS